MKPVLDMGRTFPMSAAAVNFTNGMIVTAEDLSTAMRYPLELMQSVNRAVFGCGVVCGFELAPDPDNCGRTENCDPCDGSSEMAHPGFIIEVGRGTAIDCSGLPVELCKPVRVDLESHDCGCRKSEGEVCIYIRRISAPEAPRGDCCAPANGAVQCSRLQDHVEIRAFPRETDLGHVCMRPFDEPAEPDDCPPEKAELKANGESSRSKEQRNPRREGEPGSDLRETLCDCLTRCDDCKCCGEGWILLGCLKLCQTGIVADSFRHAARYRKWIKTIECLCAPEKEKKEPGREEEEKYEELWDQAVAKEFEQQLYVVIRNEQRTASVIATGANSLKSAARVLEARAPYFQAAWGLKGSDKPLEYSAAIKRHIAEQGRA